MSASAEALRTLGLSLKTFIDDMVSRGKDRYIFNYLGFRITIEKVK